MATPGGTPTTIELQDHPASQPVPASELNTLRHGEDHEEDPAGASQLPPADGGFAAYRMMCAAFVFEALLWGFPLSFGVFQNYYSQLPEFAGNGYVSVVGTVASGLGYLGAPLATYFIKRYPNHRRHMIMAGWPVCILSLVAGSFARTLPTLILTQGVMYGVGFLIFYYPIISFIDEFWVRRRGFAYGILCGASGVSGTTIPLIIQALLRRYGYPTTLRAIAVALFVSTGPLIPLLKGRLPPTAEQAISARTDWSFLHAPLFWVYNLSNVLMGLGYFFPSLYLPSYATTVGLSSVHGALLLTVMSCSQVAGQFSFGYLSDRRVPVDILITVSLLVASIATLTSWGLSHSLPPLVVFALLYGFFGAGYTALWARMVTAISAEPTASQTIFGIFCAGKGIGNVLAGPVGAGLLGAAGDGVRKTRGFGYGAIKYEAVVLFTGACLLLSAASLGMKGVQHGTVARRWWSTWIR